MNRGGETTRQVECKGEESEVESEVDFGAEVGVTRIEEDGIVEVEVVNGGGEVEGGNENDGGSGKSGKKEEQQIHVNNIIVGKVANVVLNREEVWKLGDEVQALTEVEKDMLAKMKVMMNSNQKLTVPSLKTTNKKEIKDKVNQIQGIMNNIIKEEMETDEVNKALLVRAFLVAEGLDKIEKKVEGKNKEKGEPFWQRRGVRNIVEWRKDLGRVEEVRKGTKLKDEVMLRLVDKYGLFEKGCLAVVTLLKNKIQSGSVKIKHFTEKTLQHRQNTHFKSNQSQVYKELSRKTKTDNPSPDAAEAKAFWSGIWYITVR